MPSHEHGSRRVPWTAALWLVAACASTPSPSPGDTPRAAASATASASASPSASAPAPEPAPASRLPAPDDAVCSFDGKASLRHVEAKPQGGDELALALSDYSFTAHHLPDGTRVLHGIGPFSFAFQPTGANERYELRRATSFAAGVVWAPASTQVQQVSARQRDLSITLSLGSDYRWRYRFRFGGVSGPRVVVHGPCAAVAAEGAPAADAAADDGAPKWSRGDGSAWVGAARSLTVRAEPDDGSTAVELHGLDSLDPVFARLAERGDWMKLQLGGGRGGVRVTGWAKKQNLAPYQPPPPDPDTGGGGVAKFGGGRRGPLECRHAMAEIADYVGPATIERGTTVFARADGTQPWARIGLEGPFTVRIYAGKPLVAIAQAPGIGEIIQAERGGACTWGLSHAYVPREAVTTIAKSASADPARTALPPSRAIAAGERHTCSVSRAGELHCWGANDHGQLGDGTRLERPWPVAVKGLSGVVGVTAGTTHTCAWTGGGVLHCWGEERNGRLGTNGTDDELAPAVVTGVVGIVEAAAGNSHTCARDRAGSVWCWGQGDKGQLGGARRSSSRPQPVPGLGEVEKLAAGEGFSCALLRSKELWCWGKYGGSYGRSARADKPEPVRWLPSARDIRAFDAMACAVDETGTGDCWSTTGYGGGPQAPNPTGVATVAPGGQHACIRRGLKVECWGNNAAGQLGAPLSVQRSDLPRAVARLPGVLELALGAAHSCARTRSGQVLCWGNDANGQLGSGRGGMAHPARAVAGLSGATAVTAGRHHSCALAAGQVWCWGGGEDGQLGRSIHSSASPLQVPGLPPVAQISAGAHITCAAAQTGQVWCWGRMSAGELGVPPPPGSPPDPRAHRAAPGQVPGVRDVVEVAAGHSYVCARQRRGDVRCWGAISIKAAPTAQPVGPTPKAVPGIRRAIALSAGVENACAVEKGGEVVCWGDRSNVLDDDSCGHDKPCGPLRIDGLPADTITVEVGFFHACALQRSGGAYCWGGNHDGQLGRGNRHGYRESPKPVTLLADATALALSDHGSCALRSGGLVACWGKQQVYDSAMDFSFTTVRAYGHSPRGLALSEVAALSLGDAHGCAVMGDGRVTCWGDNRLGKLGRGHSASVWRPVAAGGQ